MIIIIRKSICPKDKGQKSMTSCTSDLYFLCIGDIPGIRPQDAFTKKKDKKVAGNRHLPVQHYLKEVTFSYNQE